MTPDDPSRRSGVRPLAGVRVVVTRPVDQSAELTQRLRDAGADVVGAPLIEIGDPPSFDALDDALKRLHTFEWVLFASANAARSVFRRLDALALAVEGLRRRRVAAVGVATGRALGERNVIVDAASSGTTAHAMAAALGRGSGKALFPRALQAPQEPVELLRQAGWDVEAPAAYATRHVRPEGRACDIIATARYDAIVFSSPSTVQSYIGGFGDAIAAIRRRRPHPAVVCIGPTTEAAARDAGLEVAATARIASDDALVEAVAGLFAGPR